MSLVTVSAAEYTCPDRTDGVFYVEERNDVYTCTNSLGTALTTVQKDGRIILRDEAKVLVSAGVQVTKNVTLDLNGHELTIAKENGIEVKGATLTVTNGTIIVETGRSASPFSVNSATDESTLTFTDTVKVQSGMSSYPVVQVTNAIKNTTVNVNGNWEVKAEVVNCTSSEKLTVNLYATVDADLATADAIVKLDNGKAVVNVKGGSYTSNKNVLYLENGTLNVSGTTTLKSTGDHAIYVHYPTTGNKHALSIKGDVKVVTEAEGKYSIYFDNATTTAKTGTYSIAGGEFTSGLDEDENQLPALYIYNYHFLETHKAWISKGTFNGGIVGDVAVSSSEYKKAPAAQAILVGNATVSEKDGVVTVGNKCQRHIKFRPIFNL